MVVLFVPHSDKIEASSFAAIGFRGAGTIVTGTETNDFLPQLSVTSTLITQAVLPVTIGAVKVGLLTVVLENVPPQLDDH